MPTPALSDDQLKAEVVSLVQYIRRFREEIAQMVSRDGDRTRFQSMSEQLDEILEATEGATHSILERMENVDSLVDDLRGEADPAKRGALCDKVQEETTQAIEACTFQDITGQRVTKIVRSMKFVEERVNAMVSLWGIDAIDEMAERYGHQEEAERDADEKLLNGPALKSEASISQDEIDKLFD
ncbi:protein phosphatase CheZ [Marivibrio halodurans]|uniref:Protein phosphatase CheZ n=1 Tax=Marivibrio halodurans TaxID=2039722 RepID=A0A8J7UZR6_9PROT|nr:protein phosphatase CheZ [Marivibrio halodurans]MBP5855961.1 protein phosphatase CheZ [Marivibrio halodurans]